MSALKSPAALRRSATVLSLVRPSHEETIACLSALEARAYTGGLPAGFAMYFLGRDGEENFVFTGQYKASHAQAVKAAARLMWRLMQVEDDGEW